MPHPNPPLHYVVQSLHLLRRRGLRLSKNKSSASASSPHKCYPVPGNSKGKHEALSELLSVCPDTCIFSLGWRSTPVATFLAKLPYFQVLPETWHFTEFFYNPGHFACGSCWGGGGAAQPGAPCCRTAGLCLASETSRRGGLGAGNALGTGLKRDAEPGVCGKKYLSDRVCFVYRSMSCAQKPALQNAFNRLEVSQWKIYFWIKKILCWSNSLCKGNDNFGHPVTIYNGSCLVIGSELVISPGFKARFSSPLSWGS